MALPIVRFDGLARVLSKVDEVGVWPQDLLGAYMAMNPKV